MLASDLTMASKPDAFDNTIALLNPKPAPKKFFALGKAIWPDLEEACQGLKIAHHARLKSGSTCSRGDVVLVASATGFDAGEVACFLSKDNQDMCILHIFSLKEKLPKHCVWEEMQSQEGVHLNAILAPVFHCRSNRGVTTLTPWQWQWQDQFHEKKSLQKAAIALHVHLQHATPCALLEAHSADCFEHTVLFVCSTQCYFLQDSNLLALASWWKQCFVPMFASKHTMLAFHKHFIASKLSYVKKNRIQTTLNIC